MLNGLNIFYWERANVNLSFARPAFSSFFLEGGREIGGRSVTVTDERINKEENTSGTKEGRESIADCLRSSKASVSHYERLTDFTTTSVRLL